VKAFRAVRELRLVDSPQALFFMKGFYIQVKNDLLAPKHFHAMGESIWLFLWCLDHMTSISENGVGKVLGGKPIKYDDLKDELDVSERSYSRWIATLKKHGYINTIRTPYGLTLSVNKASKKFKRDTPKVAYQYKRDTPKPGERYAKSGVEIRQIGGNKEDITRHNKDRDFSFEKLGKEEILKRIMPVSMK